MVIISAAICDKSGDILVARQYQNITKHQLEENMRNFPKLISPDQQHTFVETEYVRYVYLPIDNMYLVLLTKKNSNIIEDQETVRLLHQIVQELCPAGVSEENILKRDFDILLCFDDVISFGLRESVSLSQMYSTSYMNQIYAKAFSINYEYEVFCEKNVMEKLVLQLKQQFSFSRIIINTCAQQKDIFSHQNMFVQGALEMESSEEKLHIMLMKQKQAEQKEAAKRHQMEMSKKRASGISTSNNSISSSSYGSYGSGSGTAVPAFGNSSSSTGITGYSSSIAYKSKNDDNDGVYNADDKPVNTSSVKPTTIAPKKGLVLGKKGKAIAKDIATTTTQQEKSSNTTKSQPQPTLQEQVEQENSKKAEIKVNPLKAPLDIEIIEKMSCQMNREGTLTSLDVNGEIFLQLFDPAKARIAIQFEYENLKMNTMKPHVNLNKQLWTDKKQIALKNIETSFPVNTRIPSIKYRYTSTNAEDLPFNLTYWYADGSVALEVEFNSEQTRFEKLERVEISFNYPSNENPDVSSSENAEHEINSSSNVFKYIIPVLSGSSPSSNIQIGFSASLAEDDIFPFDINFTLPYTFYQIKPLAVANLADNNQLLKFDLVSKCIADKFNIN